MTDDPNSTYRVFHEALVAWAVDPEKTIHIHSLHHIRGPDGRTRKVTKPCESPPGSSEKPLT